MQTNEEFIRERKKLIASGHWELAEIRRRARNRLVMAPYKAKESNCYVGNDEYFFEEGNRTFRRVIIQREYPEDVEE